MFILGFKEELLCWNYATKLPIKPHLMKILLNETMKALKLTTPPHLIRKMKKAITLIGSIFLVSIPLCSKASPPSNTNKAIEPFTPDKTTSCNQAITKGAQNSLNNFAKTEYTNIIDGISKNALPFTDLSLTNFSKDLLKAQIDNKSNELVLFASQKYKCNLELKYPQLPQNYRF